MAIRFSRRISVVPGLRLNLCSGASVSVGHRGGWLTVGPRGSRATVSVPGTGLFWTERSRDARCCLSSGANEVLLWQLVGGELALQA